MRFFELVNRNNSEKLVLIKQHKNTRAGFTLIELLVSLFIAGILFMSIFTFIYRFGRIYEKSIKSIEEKSPRNFIVEYLHKDLLKTNTVSYQKKKKGFQLKYIVGFERSEGSIVQGKEVVLIYNQLSSKAMLIENWFQWSYDAYVKKKLSSRKQINSLEKELVFAKGWLLHAQLISLQDNDLPVLCRLIWQNKKLGKKETTLIFLGQ